MRRNIERMIEHYNERLGDFQAKKAVEPETEAKDFLFESPRDISWNRSLRNDFEKEKPLSLDDGQFVQAIYRPFFKQWLYFSRRLNDMIYQVPALFPRPGLPNRMIVVKQRADGSSNFALMTDSIMDLQSDGGTQGFPLRIYEKTHEDDTDSPSFGFDEDRAETAHGYKVKDGITDTGLKHFRDFYKDQAITKEDLFYYIYGLLHAPDYRARFADSLLKEQPRIPPVKKREDFARFVEAGRRLGDLHVCYESVDPYPATVKQGDLALAHIPDPEKYFRVEKMTFGKKGKEKDRSTIIYNANITLTDIPLEAFDYVVNGKPAIEWVMDRQKVAVDRYNPNTKKGSDIVNDPNRYAIETMGDPRYPYDLLRRVITVSLETVKTVKSLPKLDI